MNGDFDRILSFLRVCEEGSISRAAEKMFISPQALNKQIRLLEQELGEKLFDRSGRKPELTEFGAFFRSQMLPVRQQYDRACHQVDRYLNTSRDTLRVGFFQGVPKRQVLRPILTELMVGLPDTQIELGSAEMDELYEGVRSRRIDLGISNTRPGEPLEGLVRVPLMELPCSVVVSYLHPWMARERVTREDLEGGQVLFLSRAAGPDTEGFYSRLNAAACRFAPTYNAMLAQLGLGNCYAVFPTLFEDLMETGLKTFPLPEDMSLSFSLDLIYRPDNRYADFFASLASLREELEPRLGK